MKVPPLTECLNNIDYKKIGTNYDRDFMIIVYI